MLVSLPTWPPIYGGFPGGVGGVSHVSPWQGGSLDHREGEDLDFATILLLVGADWNMIILFFHSNWE